MVGAMHKDADHRERDSPNGCREEQTGARWSRYRHAARRTVGRRARVQKRAVYRCDRAHRYRIAGNNEHGGLECSPSREGSVAFFFTSP